MAECQPSKLVMRVRSSLSAPKVYVGMSVRLMPRGWDGRTGKGDYMAADWLKIKSEYVSGNVSYRELSEKYGVSQSVIRKRAAAEKWTGTKRNNGTKSAQSWNKKPWQRFLMLYLMKQL